MVNDKQQILLRKYLPNSALFDLIMFCLFFVTLPIAKPLLDREIVYTIENQKYLTWRVGIVYLVAALAQVIGFWLKRNRIAQAYNHHSKYHQHESVNLVGGIFIAIMHFIIFGVLMVNDGINYINNQKIGWLTAVKVISVILPTLTALIVSNYARRHKEIDRLNAINTFWDLIGTILLSISCCIVVTAYWELLLGDINLNFHDGKTIINILLSLLFFIGFLMLYLPARWAFLLMDYEKGYTWIRMLFVFQPFLKGLWLGWDKWLW